MITGSACPRSKSELLLLLTQLSRLFNNLPQTLAKITHSLKIMLLICWTILGRYKPDSEQPTSQPAPVCHTTTPSTDDLLQRFWETEEVSTVSPCYTPEEKVVIEHLHVNHLYLPSKRYKVSLPQIKTVNA